ncbi:MaoC family dehydratase [Zhongshania borealis]|uniref:MaoC family dehydratase n=2 Tax=Zhongshania borealis TaxID=889488 RepID=A0ABP7X292_9GAMM
MIKDIKFNDFPALRNLISEEFGEFGETYLISQEMIMLFADLTNDHQWIHVDVERARTTSPFGDTIAHGFLTLALATTLRPKLDFNITAYSSAMNYGIDQLRFLAPVVAGSRVYGRIRFDSVEEKASGTLITSEMAIHVVGSDKPSIIFKWKLLYRP